MSERLERHVTGAGAPITLFVPGMAMSIPDTRPFGSGVAGTKVFMHLRGHGHSFAPPLEEDGAWTYDALADDVAEVADAEHATRALGVSLGAGALLALLARQPGRFSRIVLALPAALDVARPADAADVSRQLADAVDAGDQTTIVRLLCELQPAAVRSRIDLRVWARRHADWLSRSPVSRPLRTLPSQAPLADLDALSRVEAPVLVLAQRDDPVHPLEVAARLADLLPAARLEVSDSPWLWGARNQLRQVVHSFLDGVEG